jgi:hypothetical protein
MNEIIIPARQVAERRLSVTSILIYPADGTIVVSTSDPLTQFVRRLDPKERGAVLALVEPTVKTSFPTASVASAKEEPKEEPTEEPKEEPKEELKEEGV